MIGDLLHYNSAGSKSIGIITDFFRYEGSPTRVCVKGDLLVAVEWVKKDIIPSTITPSYYPEGPMARSTADFWPVDWENKKWYNLKYFRVISKFSK